MNKAGLLILVGSMAAAAFLVVVWIIGFLWLVGGAFIHVLLVLALLVGGTGSIIGIVVMLVGKKAQPSLK